MYFDAVVVEVEKCLLFFRLALAILCVVIKSSDYHCDKFHECNKYDENVNTVVKFGENTTRLHSFNLKVFTKYLTLH